MEVLQTAKLEMLYRGEGGDEKVPPHIAEKFRRVVNFMEDSKTMGDIYAVKSFHCEKLKKEYAGKMSIRLNLSWRVIFTVSKRGQFQVIAIEEINNHYR